MSTFLNFPLGMLPIPVVRQSKGAVIFLGFLFGMLPIPVVRQSRRAAVSPRSSARDVTDSRYPSVKGGDCSPP